LFFAFPYKETFVHAGPYLSSMTENQSRVSPRFFSSLSCVSLSQKRALRSSRDETGVRRREVNQFPRDQQGRTRDRKNVLHLGWTFGPSPSQSREREEVGVTWTRPPIGCHGPTTNSPEPKKSSQKTGRKEEEKKSHFRNGQST
jgi:hypothetical protein